MFTNQNKFFITNKYDIIKYCYLLCNFMLCNLKFLALIVTILINSPLHCAVSNTDEHPSLPLNRFRVLFSHPITTEENQAFQARCEVFDSLVTNAFATNFYNEDKPIAPDTTVRQKAEEKLLSQSRELAQLTYTSELKEMVNLVFYRIEQDTISDLTTDAGHIDSINKLASAMHRRIENPELDDAAKKQSHAQLLIRFYENHLAAHRKSASQDDM